MASHSMSLALVHKTLKVKYSVSLHKLLLILLMDKKTEEILVFNKNEAVVYALYIKQIHQYMYRYKYRLDIFLLI